MSAATREILSLNRPVLLAILLAGLNLAGPALGQTAAPDQASNPATTPAPVSARPGAITLMPAEPKGLLLAREVAARVVRVTGRRGGLPQQPGLTGYGLVVGEVPDDTGGATLVIATPDHLVRDPAQPDRRLSPPLVTFGSGTTARQVTAELLEERVAPNQGDLAVLRVARPPDFRLSRVTMALTSIILPGTAAWQVGRRGVTEPLTDPVRYRHDDVVGWMLFEGLENDGATAGSVVVGEQGVIGMMMGPQESDKTLSRIASINFIATRMRAWGQAWDIEAQGGEVSQRPAVSGSAGVPTRLDLAPIRLVALLPAEVTARSSWVPAGARLSPWAETPVRLLASPRREAAVVGNLPAGMYLPQDAWRMGAYDIVHKLDGGAWFLVQTGGEPVGYAAGKDVVEIWPQAEVTGLAGGKVVREWTSSAGRPALLRDIGTAYEIETSLPCRLPFCRTLLVYTPAPPMPGAIIPTFQMRPVTGIWREGDAVAIRLQVPRRVVETRGTRLMACVGSDADCAEEPLLPAATP